MASLTWLPNAVHRHSPHYDDRNEQNAITLIVIHGISLPPGEFGGNFVDDLFMGRLDKNAHPTFVDIASLRVSAHFFIRRNGHLIQYVDVQKRAWHAGVSYFKGRDRCNDFSIGIELEGTDELAYTDNQYETLTELIRIIQQYYPTITQEYIVGHCNIAPERKTDPGQAFDWKRLYADLDGHSEE